MPIKYERLPTGDCATDPHIETRLNRLFDQHPIEAPLLVKLREWEWEYLCGNVQMEELCELEHAILNPLWAEYDQIIDKYLGGDQSIKDSVRKADKDGRRGLRSLKHFLGVNKIKLSEHDTKIIIRCEEDNAYYKKILEDKKHIKQTPDGCFMVTFRRGDEILSRKHTDFLSAQRFRDGFLAKEEQEKKLMAMEHA